jgi:hypothetical protein
MATSKKADPKAKSDTEIKKETEKVELNLTGDQIIIGVSGGLVPGKEYPVSADIAMTLINKGVAKLKTNN